MCNIPLLDAARGILARYRNNPYCQAHDVLLPVCSNQKMNVYLKELADICGIKKSLSTHVARHTFATLTLASGATIENVAKMLGHSDTKMTRHYARHSRFIHYARYADRREEYGIIEFVGHKRHTKDSMWQVGAIGFILHSARYVGNCSTNTYQLWNVK